jgi:hypothetical protein
MTIPRETAESTKETVQPEESIHIDPTIRQVECWGVSPLVDYILAIIASHSQTLEDSLSLQSQDVFLSSLVYLAPSWSLKRCQRHERIT